MKDLCGYRFLASQGSGHAGAADDECTHDHAHIFCIRIDTDDSETFCYMYLSALLSGGPREAGVAMSTRCDDV